MLKPLWIKAKISEIDDANVTPADYSIMVRGLPPDVTKEEASLIDYLRTQLF